MKPRRQNASVLLLTLFLILLASIALVRFTEKAMSEILGEALHVERDRLRIEAFSILETTVAVLADVSRINGALWDPQQGWADPMEYAGLEVPEGLKVRIEFSDEQGKMPLTQMSREQMILLFEVLGLEPTVAMDLTDAYENWIGIGQDAEGTFDRDYEFSETPFRPTRQPLQSFNELAAVTGFRDWFFDSQGVPNSLMRRFASMVSLYRFQQVNINSASPEVIQVWSNFGEREVAAMEGQMSRFRTEEILYFRDLGEASAQLGLPLEGNRFGVSTQCLRVTVTVTDGPIDFVVSTVVAPSGAAESLRPSAGNQSGSSQPQRDRRTRRESGRQQPQQPARTSAPGAVQGGDLNYPFAFLEIRENESVF